MLRGLSEFQEHLGGQLTIMMLEDIGEPFDVHEIRTGPDAAEHRHAESNRDRARGHRRAEGVVIRRNRQDTSMAASYRSPLTAAQLIDEYFIENRTRLLEIAAFLDRLDRSRCGQRRERLPDQGVHRSGGRALGTAASA